MRVLVCGGRDYSDAAKLYKTLDEIHNEGWITKGKITEIITGHASGADCLAECWAFNNCVTDYFFIPDWEKYGKAAGPIRNKQMLEEGKPDLVIAFPGGKGTANMVQLAREAGVEVKEIR